MWRPSTRTSGLSIPQTQQHQQHQQKRLQLQRLPQHHLHGAVASSSTITRRKALRRIQLQQTLQKRPEVLQRQAEDFNPQKVQLPQRIELQKSVHNRQKCPQQQQKMQKNQPQKKPQQ